MEATPTPPAPRRRRIWPWVLGISLVCLSPFVLLGIAAASVMTLHRDAAVLRKHVMAATDANWCTKVQFSVPNIVLGAVRTGMSLVHTSHAKEFEDAKIALKAVSGVSVGVYKLDEPRQAEWSREQLFVETDKAMQKRGWTRMVGVVDRRDTVLVYVPQDLDADEPVDICVAVVNGSELVVCSTTVDFDQIVKLAERHMKDGLHGQMKLAKFKKF